MSPRPFSEEEIRSIYEQYYRAIRLYLCRMTGNSEDASDLAQETFVRLLSQTDRPDAVKAWLYRTAYRLFVDQWRRKQRFRRVSVDALPALALAAADDPEQHFLSREAKSAMERQLNSMPADVRIIFAMKINQHASYQEIAARIGRPENTVKCWIRRARLRLASSCKTCNNF